MVNYVHTFTSVPQVTILTTVATTTIISSVNAIAIYIPNTTGHNCK